MNRFIRVPEIRCIDAAGEQMGVVPTRQALSIAEKAGLDLVEIAPQANPPVCRIMDFGKFKYEREKKAKENKKHQSAGKLKEVKFHANVGEHDFQTKIRHANDFLEQGHKVKFSLYFRGRENAHHELGFEVMQRAAQECSELGNVEQAARLIGKNLIMMMSPRPKK